VKQLVLPGPSRAADSPRIGIGVELGLVTRGDARAWATFSPCEKYRYALWRAWEDYYETDPWRRSGAPLFIVAGLNPSTADETANDPTVRKLIGFAKRHGCGALILVNVCALRSTDPKELARALKRGEDPVGPCNEEVIRRASGMALIGVRVAAWGRVPSKRLEHAAERTRWALGYHPQCFGKNDDGSPKHPLYLPYETPLVPWTR
jgi:hypothetical protein